MQMLEIYIFPNKQNYYLLKIYFISRILIKINIIMLFKIIPIIIQTKNL